MDHEKGQGCSTPLAAEANGTVWVCDCGQEWRFEPHIATWWRYEDYFTELSRRLHLAAMSVVLAEVSADGR